MISVPPQTSQEAFAGWWNTHPLGWRAAYHPVYEVLKEAWLAGEAWHHQTEQGTQQ